MEFYCMKCKKKVSVAKFSEKKTKRGIRMGQGVCPICNTRVSKILGK